MFNTRLALASAFALLCLAPPARPADVDAPQTGLPAAVQGHIDLAYLLLKGDVSRRNLPGTLYLLDPKTFEPPVPASRKLPAQPATRAFDQFYYLGTGFVSAWALTTSDGIILFDTLENSEQAAQYIEGGLRHVGLDPAKIRYIVLTHGHPDHFGGAKYLQDKYHAHVLMSGIDWDAVQAQAAAGTLRVEAPARDLSIADGQTLKLGRTTLTFYITPGHTAGTVSTLFPVTDHGRPHVVSFIGGTGLVGIPDLAKGGALLRDSLQRFARLSLAAGADVLVTCHPFLDDSWDKAKLVSEGKAGKTSPWVSSTDAVLRYYGATIEAVYAIEAWDRTRASAEKPNQP